jgi:hypothetical protein
MIGSCHYGLPHVPVLEFHNPGPTLLAGDATTSAIESAVGHAFLLASIENHCDPVSYGVLMHHSCDVQSTTLRLATLENIASSLALALASLHG